MSGLDQLCAAACAGSPARPSPSIRVIEVDAYGSVADLIQAAIMANDGAADLKAIYKVCEQHGRIAYRRADGSRIITCNDHWKSQVRHALYTGGKFQRVVSHADLWELSPAQKGKTPSLVKVLVRADDGTANIRATLNPQKITNNEEQRKTRKHDSGLRTPLSMQGTCREVSTEVTAMCDSIEPGDGKVFNSHHKNSQRWHNSVVDGPPDNHSTLQDDVVDEATNKPGNADKQLVIKAATPLAPRRSRRIITRAAAALDSAMVDEQKSPPTVLPANSVIDSHDPSSLHWGSTGLRSTIVIAGNGSPVHSLTSEKKRCHSSSEHIANATLEAESGQASQSKTARGTRKRKRCSKPENPSMPVPDVASAAAISPELLMQWTNALQQMQQAAFASQNIGNGSSTELTSVSSSAGSLPAYLPTILAAAAPFVALAAPQQIQEHMRAALELSSVALAQNSKEEKENSSDEKKK